MKILDKCRQIRDQEDGRVLLYRDEVEAVLSEGDTISRAEAIDAISCDITVTGRQNAEVVAATIGAFADRIKALPSAQPEIIHCRDCKWWRDSDHTCGEHSLVSPMLANDFCSRAERREE